LFLSFFPQIHILGLLSTIRKLSVLFITCRYESSPGSWILMFITLRPYISFEGSTISKIAFISSVLNIKLQKSFYIFRGDYSTQKMAASCWPCWYYSIYRKNGLYQNVWNTSKLGDSAQRRLE
jgi:hypothetical protein